MAETTRTPVALLTALAEAARAINAPGSLEETLDAIVSSARASVPGFDEVGISVASSGGSIETLAATSQMVWELEALQYAMDEGPCVTAIRDDPIVVAEDIRHDERWPRYIAQAVDGGLQAQVVVRLYTDDETLGCLALYSTVDETLDPQALLAAEAFATHAALALGNARARSQLTEALESRKVIGQATGILMERYEINQERAFKFLLQASSTSSLKLREVAEELVANADRRSDPPAD